MSILKETACAVFQGSLQGPLHFIIQTDDLPKSCRSLKRFLLANGTKMLLQRLSRRGFAIANLELNRLHYWLNVNRLALIYDKQQFVCLFQSGKESARRYQGAEKNQLVHLFFLFRTTS